MSRTSPMSPMFTAWVHSPAIVKVTEMKKPSAFSEGLFLLKTFGDFLVEVSTQGLTAGGVS